MSGPGRPDGPDARDRRPDEGVVGGAEMERFASFARRAAAAYHEPPPTPRDEMWAGVRAALEGARTPSEAERTSAAPDPLLATAAAGYHAPPETPRDEMWRRIEGAWELRRETREGDGGSPTRSGRIVPWLTGLAIAASLVIGIGIGRQWAPPLGTPGTPGVARTEGSPQGGPLAARDGSPTEEAEAEAASPAGPEGDRDAGRAAGADAGGGRVPLGTAPDAGTRLAAAPSDDPGAGADGRMEPRDEAAGRPPRNETALRYATLEHFGRVESLLTSFRAEEGGDGQRRIARWADDLLAETRLLLDVSGPRDPRTEALLEELELVLAQIAGLDASAEGDERELIAEGMERQGTLGRLRAVAPAGPAGYASGT